MCCLYRGAPACWVQLIKSFNWQHLAATYPDKSKSCGICSRRQNADCSVKFSSFKVCYQYATHTHTRYTHWYAVTRKCSFQGVDLHWAEFIILVEDVPTGVVRDFTINTVIRHPDNLWLIDDSVLHPPQQEDFHSFYWLTNLELL